MFAFEKVFLLPSETEAKREGLKQAICTTMAISLGDSAEVQPAGLCRAAKSLFKQLVQTQKLFQQPACCRRPQDYSAREREPAEPELCHCIKEEFVRKLCELIREADSNLTKSLRKSPAAVMSYCVPCLGGKEHVSGAVLTVENDLDKLLGDF